MGTRARAAHRLASVHAALSVSTPNNDERHTQSSAYTIDHCPAEGVVISLGSRIAELVRPESLGCLY